MAARTEKVQLAVAALVGGMPIDLAWSSARLFEREVLPALAERGPPHQAESRPEEKGS
ncbi:MAG: hypothetical protein ABSA02_27670 [Trebonia sp.]|jgi:hypothetical protein